MSETGSRTVLTALTINAAEAALVAEVCVCGGNRGRTVWRTPGDLRNQHVPTCPSSIVLSRLPWIEHELRRPPARRGVR